MPSSDHQLEPIARQLTDILDRLSRSMQALQQSMAENRQAFVAIDAARLETGMRDLEPHWQAIEALERRREEIVGRITALTGLTDVRVSALVERLPRLAGQRLNAAAAAADSAARSVRGETNAGARLLRVSRGINEDVLRTLRGAPGDAGESYDAHAKRIGSEPASGGLIIGTA